HPAGRGRPLDRRDPRREPPLRLAVQEPGADSGARRGCPRPAAEGRVTRDVRDTERMRTADCLLCSEERLTTWHFEDERCWVADCLVCATPMIVWREHGPPDAEVEAALLGGLPGHASAGSPGRLRIDG